MEIKQGSFLLGYNPCLDGVRAIAILMVLFDHGFVRRDSYGFIGVNTFFVLSGFLITCLLISEWDKNKTISLKYFYIRRALRLFPALFTMLSAFVIYVLLTTSGRETVQKLHEACWALFYFTNWAKILHFGPSTDLAPTWSLSIEEQFYLIWPLLLLFMLKRASRSSLPSYVLLAIVISVSIRSLLMAGVDLQYNDPDRLTNGLDTRADSLLIGCFVGVLVSSKLLPDFSRYKKWLNFASFISGIGLIVLCNFKTASPGMVYVGWLSASVFAAVIILQLVTINGSFMHRILGKRVFVYIGQISYGLYLWHYPILMAMKKYDLPWQGMAYLLPVFLVVLGSYYLVERPCLKLKMQFQKVN